MPEMKRWFADYYGSRRGFMVTLWHQILFRLGRYRAYREIDWTSVNRLVFVCKGNICRSAYAEVFARSLGIEAVSCGIDTQNGLPANADAIEAAQARGKDLTGHKTTPFKALQPEKGDLFLAMEPWQAEYLEHELSRGFKISLLGIWPAFRRPHIQDPYGASDRYFSYCFGFIESSIQNIASKIRN